MPGTGATAASVATASTTGPLACRTCVPPAYARSIVRLPAVPVTDVTSARHGQPSCPASAVGTSLAPTSTELSPVSTRSTSPMRRTIAARYAAVLRV